MSRFRLWNLRFRENCNRENCNRENCNQGYTVYLKIVENRIRGYDQSFGKVLFKITATKTVLKE